MFLVKNVLVFLMKWYDVPVQRYEPLKKLYAPQIFRPSTSEWENIIEIKNWKYTKNI